MKFSDEMYYTKKFYTNFGSDFRYLYNIPHLVMHFLYHQIIMLLCTSVCTEAGFGVYPAICTPLPGAGPTTRISILKVLRNESTEKAFEEEYNFSAIKCFHTERVIMGPRMRDTIRSWYMPTRFWFWANIYKSVIKANKEVRSAISFLLWTMWVGPSVPHLVVSATLWVHIHLETEYSNLYDTDGPMKLPWDIGFSIMRMFCLIYLTPCLIINNNTYAVLRYYNSIFWVYHIVLVALMIASVVIYKWRGGDAVT
ncbi:lysophospholipid acyltransferase 7-like isoform X2 [Leptidea sinapis]|nr:lysophospholipid acyltransferase 7-like isoform X2 [Leptidea sinapis]